MCKGILTIFIAYHKWLLHTVLVVFTVLSKGTLDNCSYYGVQNVTLLSAGFFIYPFSLNPVVFSV